MICLANSVYGSVKSWNDKEDRDSRPLSSFLRISYLLPEIREFGPSKGFRCNRDETWVTEMGHGPSRREIVRLKLLSYQRLRG